MQTKITLTINHSRPIPELCDLVAGRAYTLSHVEGVEANVALDWPAHVARLFVKPTDSVGRMVHAAMGAASEAGELISPVKAHWIYGRDLDKDNILEEAGDALFYIQALLAELGWSIDDAMLYNVQKLARRYPAGYTDTAANVRADKAAHTR